MNVIEAAESMGVSVPNAEAYLKKCEDIVESAQYVATLKGNTVHIVANVKGLSGRKLLRDCRATLSCWFGIHSVLFAPIRLGNSRALRLAQALGFHIYTDTDTHIWLLQTKEHFHGN